MQNKPSARDADLGKDGVEQDSRDEATNTSLSGQLGHRDDNPLVKASDSDFPEPGQNEEHTGEPADRNQLEEDSGCSPESTIQDQERGDRHNENQNQSKDDALAA